MVESPDSFAPDPAGLHAPDGLVMESHASLAVMAAMPPTAASAMAAPVATDIARAIITWAVIAWGFGRLVLDLASGDAPDHDGSGVGIGRAADAFRTFWH